MQKFTVLEGLVMPLDRANVDIDAIIPKQFLKSIKRSGFGPNAFDEWRYLDHGEPGMDNSKRPLNPDFVLNQPRYRVRRYCWRARISAAAVRANTRLGRWKTTASARSSRRVSPIFFQQLFQERPAADSPGCGTGGCVVQGSGSHTGLPPEGRPSGRASPRRMARCTSSRWRRSASIAC